MTSPVPKPGGSTPSAGLVFCLLFAALLGGDYYTLLHGPEIAQAKAVQLTKPEITASSPQQKLAARTAVLKEKQRQRQLARGRPAGAGTGSETTKATSKAQHPNQEVRAQTALKAGQRIKDKLLVKAGRFYGPVGPYLRGLLLLTGMTLVFVQKAPPSGPTGVKRKPIPAQSRRIMLGACAGVFLLAGYGLLTMPYYPLGFIRLGYPATAALVLASGGLAGLLWASTKEPAFGLKTARRKVVSPDSLYLATTDGGWITIANPYRGTLVLGGAGAGKTYSIGEPLIEQFACKNFAGLIYDFKFPVLAEIAQKAVVLAERRKETEQKQAEKWARGVVGKVVVWLRPPAEEPGEPPVQLHIVNFRDLTRSERVNPLRAADMPVVAFAEEYSRAIINNLNPSSIRKMEFFDTSAVAYLTSIIWFYRQHYPKLCTIPHVVATALHDDFRHVLSMLDTDLECGDLARALITAVMQRAEKQVAAVVGTLQVILTRINSPEMVWVLTPDEFNEDESKREGFSLNLNDPAAPKLLCIGNDPALKEAFSPVVSCIITVALKLMNQQHKHRSYVLLDEAATIYVPGLEVLPATARSNRVATVYMTQDLSQMTDAYGPEKMKVMVSNLNNQFFGKVNSLETAKFISELVGREDKQMVSQSTGTSQGGSGTRNNSSNVSTNWQERNVVRVQDTIRLQQGEFIGQTVETESTFFQGIISRADATRERFPLHPMVTFAADGVNATEALHQTLQANFKRVRQEVRDTIGTFPNKLAGASQ